MDNYKHELNGVVYPNTVSRFVELMLVTLLSSFLIYIVAIGKYYEACAIGPFFWIYCRNLEIVLDGSINVKISGWKIAAFVTFWCALIGLLWPRI